MPRSVEDVSGKEEEFPRYVFLEPTYYAPGADDDHPPHDVMGGEQLIADVYNALRAHDVLWKRSLLVILYDEHGGFYDHVSPPAAAPPDHHQEEYAFDRLGVRVPALLVSPYARKGVVQTVFDHTCLLKYLTEKWQLGPLAERVASTAIHPEPIPEQPPTDPHTHHPGSPTAENAS